MYLLFTLYLVYQGHVQCRVSYNPVVILDYGIRFYIYVFYVLQCVPPSII
jgi:hypothetical protein